MHYQHFLKEFSQNNQQAGYYLSLCNVNREQREQLASQLIQNRYQYDFKNFITTLTQLCFNAKGELFIRQGNEDFLGTILFIYLQQQLAAQLIKPAGSPADFIESLQLTPELQEVFALISDVAKQQAEPNCLNNLAQNIFNKTFNRLLIEATANISGTGEQMKFAAAIQTVISNQVFVNNFFEQRCLPQKSLESSPYEINKSLAQQEANDRVQAIKNHIKTTEFTVGNYIFFSGGVTIDIDGDRKRVPHRVAEIYKATCTDPLSLLADLKSISKQAIDKPRPGRKSDTTQFYQSILNDDELIPTKSLQLKTN